MHESYLVIDFQIKVLGMQPNA